MSKQAVLSTEVQTPATAPVPQPVAVSTEKPFVITIAERVDIAFARAAVLAQQGYVFSKDMHPETFPFTGQASITMILAAADAADIAGAAESLKQALDLQTVRTERADAEALAATAAEQERQAAKAAIEIELAAARNLVRRLDAAVKKA